MSKSNPQTWEKLLKKIDIFLASNRDQHYIFRGQSRYKRKIRSALHRHVYGDNEDADTSMFPSLPDPLEHKQQYLLQQMKDLFFPGEHELEILTQLQHLGEPTNFIDFTDDYHVALFFACATPEKSNSNPVIYFYHAGKDEFTDKNDVKLSKKMAEGNYIFRSSNPNNRIIAQRACFVHRKEGFLEISSASIPKRKQFDNVSSASKKPDEKESFYLEIPREWRQHILDYLKEMGITYRYLFNDLEGHIRYRSSYETLPKLKEKFLAVFKKAQRSSKDYAEAIALLEEMVKYDPVEAVVCASIFLLDYMKKYMIQGINDFTDIRKEFDKLEKKSKPATMFYFLRSYFYEFEGWKDKSKKWEEQLKDYGKIIDLEPDFYQVYFNRGNLYREQGSFYQKKGDLKKAKEKFDLALQDYSEAIELKPDYHNIYLNRGNLYQKQEKFDLALQDYNKAIKLNPNDSYAYNNRGVTYEKQGKLDLALQDFNKAIKLDPHNVEVYYNRGNLYADLEKFDLALQYCSEAIELKPDDAKAYNNRGVLYRRQGSSYQKEGNSKRAEEKFDLALQDYDKALELKPDFSEAYNNRGVTYEKQDKLDLALKDFEKSLKLDPHNVEAYYNRGNLYDDLKKFDLALQDYNKAIELKPDFYQAYNNRGVTYEKQDKLDLALKDFEKSLKLDPHNQKAIDNRKRVLQKIKEREPSPA